MTHDFVDALRQERRNSTLLEIWYVIAFRNWLVHVLFIVIPIFRWGEESAITNSSPHLNMTWC